MQVKCKNCNEVVGHISDHRIPSKGGYVKCPKCGIQIMIKPNNIVNINTINEVKWFYIKNNLRYGPIGEKELKDMILYQSLPRDTLVWSEGLDNWTRANTLSYFDIRYEPPPPPLPKEKIEDPFNVIIYGGFWRRAFASIIDFIICAVFCGFINTVIVTLFDISENDSSILGFFGLSVIWIYYAVFESSSKQATLGKAALAGC